MRGMRESDRAQRTTSLVKAIVLLALIGACLVWRLGGRSRGQPPTHASGSPSGWALFAALAVALQGIIFAFDGWIGIAYFSGEVKDPGREIPRALVLGLLATLAIYLLLNVAFLAVLPLERDRRVTTRGGECGVGGVRCRAAAWSSNCSSRWRCRARSSPTR